jgi:hypothetical protein
LLSQTAWRSGLRLNLLRVRTLRVAVVGSFVTVIAIGGSRWGSSPLFPYAPEVE